MSNEAKSLFDGRTQYGRRARGNNAESLHNLLSAAAQRPIAKWKEGQVVVTPIGELPVKLRFYEPGKGRGYLYKFILPGERFARSFYEHELLSLPLVTSEEQPPMIDPLQDPVPADTGFTFEKLTPNEAALHEYIDQLTRQNNEQAKTVQAQFSVLNELGDLLGTSQSGIVEAVKKLTQSETPPTVEPLQLIQSKRNYATLAFKVYGTGIDTANALSEMDDTAEKYSKAGWWLSERIVMRHCILLCFEAEAGTTTMVDDPENLGVDEFGQPEFSIDERPLNVHHVLNMAIEPMTMNTDTNAPDKAIGNTPDISKVDVVDKITYTDNFEADDVQVDQDDTEEDEPDGVKLPLKLMDMPDFPM